jgi:hypothetical protein
MACGEGTAVIACSPRQVLELVLDVERYRLADRKVGRVHWVRRDGNHGQVKHNGRLLGLPTPPIVLAFTLTPWSRLDFEIVTAPWPLRGFQGVFTCEETAHGTRVMHRECFTLHPLAGLLDPLFGAWLARDTPREVTRIRRLLEHARGS